MNNLFGKRCFVTGGANGIGKAIVTAFYQAGVSVAFCDVDERAGKELADSLPSCYFYPVDVKDSDALIAVMDQAWEAMDGIDIVVNNVGLGFFSPLVETPIERFDEALMTNLRPVFITSRELARRQNTDDARKKYGRIINIASTRYLQSESGTEGYAASKGGIVSLTHALMMSLSDYNITVNCISPGWIDTGHYGALKPGDHAQHPSGRVGVPEDIARACLFLADPENNFINGQNIVIDGGMTKKMIYIE